ncbi:MAG: Gfo/Idh/MocA family oxidoreductase [Kiritimatiellae bacterium]|nr:Gfo/Idh/MocA family oxidoreductase [Kiritimatiellia bacterium]
MSTSGKQRFIIAGLGNRGRDSFARALLSFPDRGLPEFKQKAEIVAFVDINPERARVANEVLGTRIPVFAGLAEAASKHPADWAIITTNDNTHADICVEALRRGMSVIVDKPLATSVWECERIVAASREAGRQVVVGHNMRYNEHMFQMARMVRSGAIGKVQQVESGEVLDLTHGGSYFHRWHSEFSKSSGLLNHKCCHQLDIINWVIDDRPVGVSAMGDRTYFVPRPDLKAGPRCSQCAIAKQCPHYCNIDVSYPGGRPEDEKRLRRMYVDVEHVDGFIRDACVFSDRNTINDHEVLNIRYAGGVLGSFSLMTFAPREYNYFYFTGTEGRLEYSVVFEPNEKLDDNRSGAETGFFANEGKPQIRLLHKDGKVEFINVKRLHKGYGHGGADVKLIASVLGVPIEGVDPIQRATPEQARNAVAIADMAARSIAGGGRYVAIEETGRDRPPLPPSARRKG